MLLDSDIMIWQLRGNKLTTKLFNSHKSISISVVTYMEIVRGIQNKESLYHWKSFIKEFNIRIIMIDEEISSKAMYLCDEFSLSHGLASSDALISATALTHGLMLVTGNTKDFRFIPNLIIHPFKI